MNENLRSVDPEVAEALRNELNREQNQLELIASENFVSYAVLQTQGSIMTNKYAEGYPGRRWYGGCENMDAVESLAINRAKALFKADHANVQPHSGAQANMAVYFLVLQVGDVLMGMSLKCGGHLTHGMSSNFSGRFFKIVSYGVDRKTHLIDFAEVRRLAREYKPKLIIAGASAYPRTIEFAAFREIADEIGAYLVTDMAHIAGLIAAGYHPSPVEASHFVTTTTHKTLRGPRGGMILCQKEFAKDIDKTVFPGVQGGPLMHVIAAKAVALKEAMKPEFALYQKQIIDNAKALAQELSRLGNTLVSGGTDNHLMLMDLTELGISGKEAQTILEEVNITTNKNVIPYDKRSSSQTSGIRLGTPALTTRGMKEDEMVKIARLIDRTLRNREEKQKIREEVKELCEAFPLYKDLEGGFQWQGSY